MQFKEFRNLFQKRVMGMLKDSDYLFVVNVDKDELWDTYLDNYPEGSNEVFRKRRAFDCSCCRRFIKQFGGVVTIVDNKIETIWDFETGDDVYQPVTDALSYLVKTRIVNDRFVTKQAFYGTDENNELLEDKSVLTWSHFCVDLPQKFLSNSDKSDASLISNFRDIRNVFERSLNEITQDAIEIVLDLITEQSLYKGNEWEHVLTEFLELHKLYHKLSYVKKNNFCWSTSAQISPVVSKLLNHSMGVLLKDISKGVNVIVAAKKFANVIVAPEVYKHPKQVYSVKRVEEAEAFILKSGLKDSLGRRHAQLDDITIANVIWANKDAAKEMQNIGVFEALKQEVLVNPKRFDKVENIGIEYFIDVVLPTTTKLEILLESRHEPSLVSLIAPKVEDKPTLFKWNNPFSWAYNHNLTDSMKQQVKAAGGSIDGVIRCSLRWDNQNDLDIHVIEPDGNRIHYPSKGRKHPSSGMLDVDIINPIKGKPSIENITWSNFNQIQEGLHTILINNYTHRGGVTGFEAEIEYEDVINEYVYPKELRHKESVVVAKFEFNKQTGIRFIESLPSSPSLSSKEMWGLKTNQFHPVSVCTFSPNYWDKQKGLGHKHYLFMLGGCKNDTNPNGFFNEYLQERFLENKRFFATLGSHMKVEYSPKQLSGLGFSDTKRNWFVCKLNNKKIIKVII